MMKYTKSGNLGGSRHGDTYQICVLMLIHERAASEECFSDFLLATEMDSAGKFDDAVLAWKDPDHTAKWLFVQIKHKQKGSIKALNLFPTKEDEIAKGDFSLSKYLVSMWEIHHSGEFEGDKQFVLHSNSAIDDSIGEWFSDAKVEGEVVLQISESTGRFLKLCVNEEQVKSRIDTMLYYTNKDFEEVERTLRAIFVDRVAVHEYDILSRYRGALVNKVIQVEKCDNNTKIVRFTPRFVKNKKLDHNEGVLRERLFERNSTLEQMQSYSSSNDNVVALLTSKHDSNNKLPVYIDKQEAIQYINRLTFAVNQPNKDVIKRTIRNDVARFCSIEDSIVKNHYSELLFTTLEGTMHDWLDLVDEVPYKTKTDFQNTLNKLQQTIDKSGLDVTTEKFNGKMRNLRVSFTRPSYFIQQFPLIWVSSTNQALLSILKLFQIFNDKCYRYSSLEDLKIENIRSQMFEALRRRSSELFFFLKEDTGKFDFFDELVTIITQNGNIKLILITNCLERVRPYFVGQSFSIFEDTCTSFDELTPQTQQMLMNRTIVFQNTELKLADLLKQEVPKTLFRNEMLEKLIVADVIEIGPTLPELQLKCYIPRTVRSCKSNIAGLQADFDPRTRYSEETFVQNFTQIFTDCKLLLLSAQPGMGKSTFLVELARQTKRRYRSSLVLHLKLRDCVGELRKLSDIDDMKNVLEFLGKVSGMETPFEKSLLAAFLRSGSCCIFLDGLDELPYDTVTVALNLLGSLQNYVLLFVSTRIHQNVVIEHANFIKMKTFYLEPLNKREQLQLMLSVCEITSDDPVLVKLVRRMIYVIHSNLTKIADKIIGVPLILSILADMYRKHFESFGKSLDFSTINDKLLTSTNLLDLFEALTYNSFRRQQIETLNLSIGNPHTERMLDQQNYAFKGFVKLHCYLGLLMLVKRQNIQFAIRDEKELAMLQEQARLLNSAIASTNIEGSPYFADTSFGEFFAAKWLFENFHRMDSTQLEENFSKNENGHNIAKGIRIVDLFSLYIKILQGNATVRKFFLLMVKSDKSCWDNMETLFRCMHPYPLMWACKENFIELVRRLLEEDGSIIRQQVLQKVNAVNANGQTALHVAASRGFCNIVNLLIERGATLDSLDKNSQTALHLASKGGHLEVVQLLTKNGCNINALTSRKWNALHLAAFGGHAEVVRFLIAERSGLRCGAARKWLQFLGPIVHKFPAVVGMLVRYDISVTTDESSIEEVLSWAIKQGHASVLVAICFSETDERRFNLQNDVHAYLKYLRKNVQSSSAKRNIVRTRLLAASANEAIG